MNNDLHIIKRDVQIKKFCFYGFFKNLKFFEPYLLIYLNAVGLDLFQIGLLISIRAGVTIVFEVPSAIIADYYGKKNELLMCFTFYIVSFVFFFWGSNFIILAIGMVFFGLGEAFRSGTHKAMILGYLENKEWCKYKAFVYGRTRSFSLVGSSLSAFVSIIFVLQLPVMKWIFIISILPYIIDFILISTYPDFLNEGTMERNSIKEFWLLSVSQIKTIFNNHNILKVVMSAASYDGVFKSIKDYIQPILSVLVLSEGLGALANFDESQTLNIYLGILYCLFYIFSAVGSKNIFRLTNRFGAISIFEKIYDIMGILLILLSILIHQKYLFATMLVYFIIYILMNSRKPAFLEVASENMDKRQRVTVLSIESQLKALLMMIMSPIFGYIAEAFSLSTLFLLIGCILLIQNRFLKLREA